MELEGNPGSALRETIDALDGMTTAMAEDRPGEHSRRKAQAMAMVRRYNDLLTRVREGLQLCSSDSLQRRLEDEINAFLKIEGYQEDDGLAEGEEGDARPDEEKL